VPIKKAIGKRAGMTSPQDPVFWGACTQREKSLPGRYSMRDKQMASPLKAPRPTKTPFFSSFWKAA
jgi:hypothetical protein